MKIFIFEFQSLDIFIQEKKVCTMSTGGVGVVAADNREHALKLLEEKHGKSIPAMFSEQELEISEGVIYYHSGDC